ncbi:concanavalin A-like lectin/glucanase domain-containing protein [Dichomitus squalens]|uniref:GH16 domain-containing protein n=1 Tax=Dichomitus squalens (strain LYAD-421) TaxID=732165 RepID=R7SQH7_DICSQ|nr:uncharacterized protein DICSQDRAFT_90672 [Dichomitus squalens LYAD-421 SS1]EJF58454.1 hypothetical protein DICSQDRAFT_90672 [Dichomitus squalens LYAD-421 SS1]TBU48669.1 concanavalin A-like lectin/glucanase domain-containing protein [Dichomitus squalens]
MIVHVPLLVFLLANVAPTDAGLFSRSSDSSLSRAARHARRNAIKQSSGLWDDIRLAYTGMFQQKPQVLQSKLYCTNNAGTGLSGLGLNNTSGADGNDGDGDGSHTTSGSSHTTEAPSASSPASVSVTETGTAPSSTTTSSGAPSGSGSSSSPWKVAQSYEGSSFFDGWVFTNAPDDTTHGIAQYVDQGTAQSAGLIEVNGAGNAVMRVETTPTVSGNRMSIRITTEYTYTGGLIIMDAVHMPTGCGTWPAFWSNGPNWPAGGEIDMVEGVNDYTNVQVTLHAEPGCTMSSADPNVLGMTGSVITSTDCGVSGTSNSGCGVRASQTNSYGAAFNDIGGGVYATLWDDDGVKTWFFPRSAIPSDIANGAPQPTGWGSPVASFPSSSCAPFSKYFYQHTAIFDTTLCGDWAGNVWSADSSPGQSQTCAQSTGVAACVDFVRGNGSAFDQAYWEVKSVKIYQSS